MAGSAFDEVPFHAIPAGPFGFVQLRIGGFRKFYLVMAREFIGDFPSRADQEIKPSGSQRAGLEIEEADHVDNACPKGSV